MVFVRICTMYVKFNSLILNECKSIKQVLNLVLKKNVRNVRSFIIFDLKSNMYHCLGSPFQIPHNVSVHLMYHPRSR